MAKRRSTIETVVNPRISPWFAQVAMTVEVTGTVTDSIPVYVATRKGRVLGASLVQESSPDGQKTLKVRNLTQGVDVTDAVDSDALAADTSAAFAITAANEDFAKGDVLSLEYTVATAGITAPGEVTVVLDLGLEE